MAWNNLMRVALFVIRGCFAIWPPEEFSHSTMHTVIQSMIHMYVICLQLTHMIYDAIELLAKAWQSIVMGGPTHLPHNYTAALRV